MPGAKGNSSGLVLGSRPYHLPLWPVSCLGSSFYNYQALKLLERMVILPRVAGKQLPPKTGCVFLPTQRFDAYILCRLENSTLTFKLKARPLSSGKYDKQWSKSQRRHIRTLTEHFTTGKWRSEKKLGPGTRNSWAYDGEIHAQVKPEAILLSWVCLRVDTWLVVSGLKLAVVFPLWHTNV